LTPPFFEESTKKRDSNATDRKQFRLVRNDPPGQPEAEDLVTTDHQHFFAVDTLHKGVVVTVPAGDDWRPYVRDYTEKEPFFPNVWFISDHGNSHLLNWED
jgi:hypothetical protein